MLYYLRAKGSSFLVASLLLFSALSCKKKEETVVPEDVSGSLDVTFSPAGSVQFLILSQQGNSNKVGEGTPDATGYLKLTNLQAGNYVVTFTTPYDYNAPTPRNITITAKGNTALGTIQVDKANTNISHPLQGNAGWTSTITATGAATTATNAATTGSVVFYNGTPTFLTVNTIYQNGTAAETIQLGTPYAGVAQYTLGNVTGAGIGSYLRTVGGATTNSYSTAMTGSQGTLTVTAHDLTKRTITGTFGFNGYDSRGVKGVTVSTGTFSVSY
jgi:hypothetical protein